MARRHTNPIALYQLAKISLVFLDSFVNQQHGNIVLHGIHPAAGAAFELILILVVGKRSFADWTGEDLQQVAANHNEVILPPVLSAWR